MRRYAEATSLNRRRQRSEEDDVEIDSDYRNSRPRLTRDAYHDDDEYEDGGDNHRHNHRVSPGTSVAGESSTPTHYRSHRAEVSRTEDVISPAPSPSRSRSEDGSSYHDERGEDDDSRVVDDDASLQLEEFPNLLPLLESGVSCETSIDIDSVYLWSKDVIHILSVVPDTATFMYPSLRRRDSGTSSSRFRVNLAGVRVQRSFIRDYKVGNAPLSWFPNIEIGSVNVGSYHPHELKLNMYYLGIGMFSKTNYFTYPMMAVVNRAFNMALDFSQSCEKLGLSPRDILSRATRTRRSAHSDITSFERLDKVETPSGNGRKSNGMKSHMNRIPLSSAKVLFQYFMASLLVISELDFHDVVRRDMKFFLTDSCFTGVYTTSDGKEPYTLESMIDFARDLRTYCCFTLQAANLKHITNDPTFTVSGLAPMDGVDYARAVSRNANHCISTFVSGHYCYQTSSIATRKAVAFFVDVGIEIKPKTDDEGGTKFSFLLLKDEAALAVHESIRGDDGDDDDDDNDDEDVSIFDNSDEQSDFLEVDVSELQENTNDRATGAPIEPRDVALAAEQMKFRRFDHFGTRGLVGNVHGGPVRCAMTAVTSAAGSENYKMTFPEHKRMPCGGQFYSPTLVMMNRQTTRKDRGSMLDLPAHLMNCLSEDQFPYMSKHAIGSSTRKVSDCIIVFQDEVLHQETTLARSSGMAVRLELFFRVQQVDENEDCPRVYTLKMKMNAILDAIVVVDHDALFDYWIPRMKGSLAPLLKAFHASVDNRENQLPIDLSWYTPEMKTALLWCLEKLMVAMNLWPFTGKIHKNLSDLYPNEKGSNLIPEDFKTPLDRNIIHVTDLKYGLDPMLLPLPKVSSQVDPRSMESNLLMYKDNDVGIQSKLSDIGVFLPRTFMFARAAVQQALFMYSKADLRNVPPDLDVQIPTFVDPVYTGLAELAVDDRKVLWKKLASILWFVYRKEWFHILYRKGITRREGDQSYPGRSPPFAEFPLTEYMLNNLSATFSCSSIHVGRTRATSQEDVAIQCFGTSIEKMDAFASLKKMQENTEARWAGSPSRLTLLWIAWQFQKVQASATRRMEDGSWTMDLFFREAVIPVLFSTTIHNRHHDQPIIWRTTQCRQRRHAGEAVVVTMLPGAPRVLTRTPPSMRCRTPYPPLPSHRHSSTSKTKKSQSRTSDVQEGAEENQRRDTFFRRTFERQVPFSPHYLIVARLALYIRRKQCMSSGSCTYSEENKFCRGILTDPGIDFLAAYPISDRVRIGNLFPSIDGLQETVQKMCQPTKAKSKQFKLPAVVTMSEVVSCGLDRTRQPKAEHKQMYDLICRNLSLWDDVADTADLFSLYGDGDSQTCNDIDCLVQEDRFMDAAKCCVATGVITHSFINKMYDEKSKTDDSKQGS